MSIAVRMRHTCDTDTCTPRRTISSATSKYAHGELGSPGPRSAVATAAVAMRWS